ncbi:MAG: phage replisome organizer N-terminal domain-containing protein [Acholeplasma sp.]|nr:phage replisome organizer N-terminal domain-containing protein [Acholeplasma sp.]
MAEPKKYYWLKLDKNFFKRHDIRIVESMPNGKSYILLYLKLLLESIDHEGLLRFNESIPYNEDMIATITDTNVDIVKSGLQIFKQLDLLEVTEDHTIFMKQTSLMLGAETEFAIKKRDYRERQKQLSDNSKTKKDNVRQEIEKDIEIEIEKDIEIDLDKKGQGVTTSSPKESFTKPSLSEIIEYKSELKSSVDAEYFLDYHIANGWKVSKGQPMKDWKATFRNWTRNQKDTSKKDSQNQASHTDTPESIKRAQDIGIIMI